MECKNPIICSKHGHLVSMNEHSDNITRFLLSENPYDEDPVRDWFKVCSGITKVAYTEGLFDQNSIFCGPAIDYDEARSNHLGSILLQLTWFTYLWGGFEAFVDTLTLPPCPQQRGKFNAVAYYLSENFEPHFSLPPYYANLVTLLTNYLKANPWYNKDGNLFNLSPCAARSAQGLTIVYKIRNQFAHGAFTFSEPEDYQSSPPFDSRIIHISCRVVLLTMQMMLMAMHRTDGLLVERRDESFGDGSLDALVFLKKLHVGGFET